ncbi:hypothetical protein FISHEDRAFT_47111, partial [Fistulina hepatica ATCC 64428]
NNRLLTLLYRTAEWHGHAKLRLHTDQTLKHLEMLTKEYGRLIHDFCKFANDEGQYNTVELPKEANTRVRNQVGNNPGTASVNTAAISTRRARKLNINTYKWHAMGDYSSTIRLFGATDSYSTQVVCSSVLSLQPS